MGLVRQWEYSPLDRSLSLINHVLKSTSASLDSLSRRSISSADKTMDKCSRSLGDAEIAVSFFKYCIEVLIFPRPYCA